MDLNGGCGRIVFVGLTRSIQIRSADETLLREDDDLLGSMLKDIRKRTINELTCHLASI